MQTDHVRRQFWLPSWLKCIVHRTKRLFELGPEFDTSKSYMKFEGNPVILNDSVRVSTREKRQAVAIFSTILFIVRLTEPIFESV